MRDLLPGSSETIVSSHFNGASRREVLTLASSGALAAAFFGVSGLSRLTSAQNNTVSSRGLFASAEASPGEGQTVAALASASGGQNGAAAVGSIASAVAPVNPDREFMIRRQPPVQPMFEIVTIESGGTSPALAPAPAAAPAPAPTVLPAAGSGSLHVNAVSRWGAMFGAAGAAAVGAILLRSRTQTEPADT
jgi:hypothetical protein